MPPLFRFKFTGGPELAKALEALPKAVQGKTLEDALLKSAEPIVEEAERLAPKLSGELATDIEAEPGRTNDKTRKVVIGPEKDDFYGMFQEFGTRHNPAQPFLRPAWDARVEDALNRLIAELREGIEDAARRGGK